MLIRHKKTMTVGVLLGLSFIGVLVLIFSPVFGEGKNGLEYSDALFNKLAKGSSYFIPELTASLKEVQGKDIGGTTIKMENADAASNAAKILTLAHMNVVVKGSELTINGDLAKELGNVLDDSSAMYYNKGSEISQKYGMDEKEVMSTWWGVLNKTVKEFQKTNRVMQATVIQEVMKKGIEPAFNFYNVEPQKVSDKALTVTGLLLFYILYTMWWGYAIFNLFDGLGLSMTKAKVKQEV
ncbi:MAG: hypothetical protein ABSH41_13315 [Syntrophobacteraceae bacterium]|jgi:hypothetical protein